MARTCIEILEIADNRFKPTTRCTYQELKDAVGLASLRLTQAGMLAYDRDQIDCLPESLTNDQIFEAIQLYQQVARWYATASLLVQLAPVAKRSHFVGTNPNLTSLFEDIEEDATEYQNRGVQMRMATNAMVPSGFPLLRLIGEHDNGEAEALIKDLIVNQGGPG
jgi:hypothetical protein